MKPFKQFVTEAFQDELGDYPNISNPERVERFQKHPVTSYGADTGKYGAQHYKELIDKVRRYTGNDDVDVMQLHMMAMKDLQEVMEIEQNNKAYLEQLAVKTVLEMEDFRFIKDLVEKDELRIDAKLVQFGEMDIFDDLDNLEDEEQDPEVELSLAEILMDDDERKARMALANAISQGEALNAQYVFNLLGDELSRLSDKLIKQYGFLVAFGTLSYFAVPPGMEEMARSMQGGQADVDDNNEDHVYTIKARAVIFPVLIQEIVKGIYQYLSLTHGLKGADSGDLSDESDDIIIGPTLTKYLRQAVPTDKIKFLPVVVQEILVNFDPESVKELLGDPNKAKSLVQDIITGIETGWEEPE